MWRWLAAVAAAAVWAASSGCATCKTPPPFYVALEADRSANAHAATRVLILQLKNLDAIQVADFNELRKDPAASLAETLVGKPEEMWVNAGEVEARWVARDKDARHVAAVAVFQNPSQKWWASHRLKPVPMLQCREVAVESVADRRPYSSEEQMRFYLDRQEISSEGAAAPPPRPAESARTTPDRKGKGA